MTRLAGCIRPVGGEVGLVEHHARREAGEAGAAVGLDDDDAGRSVRRRVAEQQRVADLRGRANRAPRRRPRPCPAPAPRRRRPPSRPRPPRSAQLAAQRIGVAHRLDADQPRRAALGVGRAAHAREVRGGRRRQAERARLGRERRRRRLVARDDRVAAEQLARVARQAAVDAVGEEADRRQRADRERHGDHQQAQLAGAKVARRAGASRAARRRRGRSGRQGARAGRRASRIGRHRRRKLHESRTLRASGVERRHGPAVLQCRSWTPPCPRSSSPTARR